MNRKSATLYGIFGVILAVVILFEYGKSFHFYFVGDDFWFIEYVLNEKIRILWKPSVYYHYYPLGLTLNTLPACFGSFDPVWFVAVNYMFFAACSLLVMALHHQITGSISSGFLAALIFATAVPNSEVIYWKTGNQTAAMTFFALLAFALFVRHIERPSKRMLAGCMLAYAASILSIEQGMITLGFFLLYDLMFHSGPRLRDAKENRKTLALSSVGRYAPLVSVPLGLGLLKTALGAQASAFPLANRDWMSTGGIAVETLAYLIDLNSLFSPLGAPKLKLALFTIPVLTLLFLYAFLRKDRSALFFLLASVGSISVISLAAGGPNARYYCLPSAFYACFLVVLVNDAARALTGMLQKRIRPAAAASLNSSRKQYWGRCSLCVGACLALAFAGFRGNIIRREYWEIASRIELNMAQSVENLFLTGFASDRPPTKVFLLDIPAYMRSNEYSLFFIASNSLMPDLRHRLGGAAEIIELIASGSFFEMEAQGERLVYRVLGRENMKGKDEIEKLVAQGNLVFRFSPSRRTLVPLNPQS